MVRRLLPFLVPLTVILAACAPYGPPLDPWTGPAAPWGDPFVPADERGRADPREGVAHKKVAAKQEHTLLIAHDGSECQVSPERWKKIAVGDALWCYWRVEDGGVRRPAPAAPAADSPSS